MAYGVIYKITNELDGKIYIGQTTISVEKRFNQHAKKITSAIGEAIQTYGKENFSVEILEECPTRKQLCTRERFWIRELSSKSPNGYNVTGGGEIGRVKRDIQERAYLAELEKAIALFEAVKAMPAETEMQLRNRAIVSLMVTSGLRCCEVQKALYEDLRTAGDSEVLYIQGKGHTSKDDYVKVAPAVGNMIRDYLKVRFKGNEPKARDYLFVSTSRNHATFDKDDELSTQAIRAIVKKAMKDIGFTDSRHTAHSLRHTAATLMLRSGEDLNNVKQVLRHSNVQTTMIYAHALEREKNNAELAVSNLLFGETK